MDTLVIIAVSLIVAYLLYKLFWAKPGPPNGPPCLPALPLLGSLPFLNNYEKMFLCFMEKSKRYGNVFAFYSGTRYTVVLNGIDAMKEALVKKSSDFAGRIAFYSDTHVLNPAAAGFINKQYNEVYKRNQTITLALMRNYGFGDKQIMETMIQEEVGELIKIINNKNGEPINPINTIEFSTLNVIYGLLFGGRLEENDETQKFITFANRAIAYSYTPVLLAFPIAVHLPHIKKMLAELAPTGRDITNFYKKKIAESRNLPESNENFVKDFIQKSGKDFDENELIFILRDLLLAGAETASTTCSWGLIYLANHPDIQRRMQKEIDSVLPRDKLPSLSDKAKLPYTEAVILEVMRVQTLSPLGAPHVTMCDTEVYGHKIPKDTMVLTNIWSAHMDPKIWPEPEEFRPERFYNEKTGEVMNQNQLASFSFGKRACLGEVLARQEVFLYFVSLVQNFQSLPPEGLQKISTENVVGGTNRPADFRIRLVART